MKLEGMEEGKAGDLAHIVLAERDQGEAPSYGLLVSRLVLEDPVVRQP
jgi:hypothetical protein